VRISVDRDVCDLHGQCVFTAPELFRFDDAGHLEYTEVVPAELVGAVRRAARVCPTAAIELVE
jgi:ferredoxin